jgi:hypothetical protein
MNEAVRMVAFRDFMGSPEGWGRDQGREVYQRLLRFVETSAGTMIFKVSLKDVRRLDISFASETIVELARRYRGLKGFCLVDLSDEDLIENWDAAAAKKSQPILVWKGRTSRVLGCEPSPGNREAYEFALSRPQVRVVEFASANKGMSVANASMKFKQLWEQGFLLRRESTADTGGVEFVYHRIG